jgi:hypothetical protein
MSINFPEFNFEDLEPGDPILFPSQCMARLSGWWPGAMLRNHTTWLVRGRSWHPIGPAGIKDIALAVR